MRFHLLTADGTEVACGEGLLTEGVTFTVNGLPEGLPEGTEELVITRVVVDDPSMELADVIHTHLALPITIMAETGLSASVVLDVQTGSSA